MVAVARLAAALLFLAAGAVVPAVADWSLAILQTKDGRFFWGFGGGESNPVRAKARAIVNCKYRGCHEVWKGSSGCIALATGNGNGAWQTGNGANHYRARSSALAQCTSRSPTTGCHIEISYCDTTHGFEEARITPEDDRLYQRWVSHSQNLLAQARQRAIARNQREQAALFSQMLNAIVSTAINPPLPAPPRAAPVTKSKPVSPGDPGFGYNCKFKYANRC